MRPISDTAARHWDGSRIAPRRHRTLRVAADSPSRLLRIAQRSQCRTCGNRVDRHTTTRQQPIALHPAELPAAVIPQRHRWHLASGIAYPAADATPWCRVIHRTLCPAQPDPEPLPPALDSIRRRLALTTRRLLDTKTFTPHPERAAESPATRPCRPTRPVVQLLYGRYLATKPVEDIQCVAQTRRRTRCPHPVLAPDTEPGRWTMAPAPHLRRQLAISTADIALYDLSHLTYREQVRWRTQRCPAHAATPGAPDLALADWEPFNPLRHYQHLVTRLPTPAHHRPRH
ncbi:DUF6083 domain-containing protein [Streptomyces sp. NPDC002992]|uniref:DUF6083 domain-containing protein n=1 Tax=Streptomyces sp. NPDC002992 TaxID=3154273 RepID=UPI0033AD00BD